MRRSTLCFGLLLGSVPFVVSRQSADVADKNADAFSRQEWAILKTLSPLPALPVDTMNKYRDSLAAALLGQKLLFEPRLSGPIQTGTPQQGQLGAIGETGKIACRNCHMPESKWLFDIRSNNGGAIPNATALGSAWMTRNVSSIINTVFYVHPGSGAHWRENDGYSDSEWFDAQSEPEGPPVQNGSRLPRMWCSSTITRNTLMRFLSGRSTRVLRTTADFPRPARLTRTRRTGIASARATKKSLTAFWSITARPSKRILGIS